MELVKDGGPKIDTTMFPVESLGEELQAVRKYVEQDPDVLIKARIADWLRKRFEDGGSFDDTPELLLDFYKFLQECEAIRTRA